MILYLKADSKNKVGYTPDWLKVRYSENGQDFELVLDIQGSIDYDMDCLNCRCKGDLVPWVLHNLTTGDEVDLYDLEIDEINAMFPDDKVASIIRGSNDFEVGIYPRKDDDEGIKLAEGDVLSNCHGKLEMPIDGGNRYETYFKFEVELNY